MGSSDGFLMPDTLTINSKVHPYRVKFQEFDLRNDSSDNSLIYILDQGVSDIYKFPKNLRAIYVEASEKNKDFKQVGKILANIEKFQANKSSKIIAIGGGITQDLSTMACSLYMRGLNWCYVPTTLQSMIDSCIGGKSSINGPESKNLLGNYYPPNEVIIDVHFLETLSGTDMKSGLLEGIKINAVHSLSTYEKISKSELIQLHQKIINRKYEQFEVSELIKSSLENKKSIIEVDEFDLDLRQTLNFGHTFGHLIESITRYAIPHGIAIGIGMIAAFEFSRAHKLASHERFNLEEVIKDLIKDELIINEISKIRKTQKEIGDILDNDKKSRKTTYKFVLPVGDCIEVKNFEKNSEVIDHVVLSIEAAVDWILNG